ncbi:NACHT domain-containing protein [Streptomyces sp. 4N509B]|uniref:NACHT domain-containing protein n=1 Tax=Streptomyces sp. 4N509B TaxID=3457413 RepID=UPI003FD5F4C0
MDAAAAVGLRLGSTVVAPLVKKLFRAEQPGAGLVDEPVRIASLVSFRGEKRTLTRQDLEKLARKLVRRAVAAAGPGETPPEDEHEAVAMALADTLAGLGELDMDDVQAVRLGADGLARALSSRHARELSRDAEQFHGRLVQLSCLHVLDFFTRRSTFVARTLVEQARQTDRLVATLDLLVERLPAQHAEDAAFEERYRRYVAHRHGRLTIFGIDLDDEWPLDDAYLSLETTESGPHATDAGPEAGHEDRRGLPGPPQRAEQALAGRERVLLRGVAGAGKTTLVQWLAVTTAEHRLGGELVHLLFGRVPFVLPLRTLTRAGGALPAPRDFLSAVGCPHTPPSGWAERVLADGRALLLVDGIDEVPEEQRDDTRRWLRELLAAFPGTVCLVTARPSAVREDWLAAEGFGELSLAPMSREDVAAFVERWHRAADAGQERADALLAAIHSRSDLARLATNPLMCGLICALHRASHGYLPQGREELYEAALRMLLERRDRQRGIDHGQRMDARSQALILERLAYWLIRNGHSQMERADAVELIDQVLPTMRRDAASGTAEDVYRYLLDRSGLLREPAPDVVDFVHRTFQDYLAARAVVENRDFPLLVRHAHLDQWEDVVRMAVAHARPDERKRLLTQLVKRGDTVRKHRVRLHLLAMACLEHATQLDPGVREEVERRAAALIPPRTYEEARSLAAVGPVALELLPGPDGLTEDEAWAVVEVAHQVGGDAALRRLVPFRDHPAVRVRGRLLRDWSRFDHERFGTQILAGLSHEGAPRLQLHTEAELDALRTTLPDHPYLAFLSGFTEAQILGAVGSTRLRELTLSCGKIASLAFLERFRSLTRLSVIDGPEITDLSPLTTLTSLDDLLLRLLPELHDLRCLNDLPELRTLYVGDGVPITDLDRLPTRAPLTDLVLPSRITDLTGISAWPGLTRLTILDDDHPPTRASLAAIAGLPALTSLWIPPRTLHALRESGLSLPQVDELRLYGVDEHTDLKGLATLLPELAKLRLVGYDPRGSGAVDLSPLRELGSLRSVEVEGDLHATHHDALPQATVTQPPTSRY